MILARHSIFDPGDILTFFVVTYTGSGYNGHLKTVTATNSNGGKVTVYKDGKVMIKDTGGTVREVTTMRVKDTGGTVRKVRYIKIKDTSGTVHTIDMY